MSNTNTINIGFEDQIWSAENILKGNMDASGYKNQQSIWFKNFIYVEYISL